MRLKQSCKYLRLETRWEDPSSSIPAFRLFVDSSLVKMWYILAAFVDGDLLWPWKWMILPLFMALHRCVHSCTLVFSRGCLLPCVGRTDVQWSQIRFNGFGSELCVIGSSWELFPVKRGFSDHSSNRMMMVFIGSTACTVTETSKAALSYH